MDFSGITHHEKDNQLRLNEADGRAMTCLRELRLRGFGAEQLAEPIRRMAEARGENSAAGMETLLRDLTRQLEAMDSLDEHAQETDLRYGG